MSILFVVFNTIRRKEEEEDEDITAIVFNNCDDITVWDECIAAHPNVRELWFKDCSTPTNALTELCSRIDVLCIDFCSKEFITACMSRFNGHTLHVHSNYIAPIFSVARLTSLHINHCVVTDHDIDCIVGSRLLEDLNLTNSRVSDIQLMRVIDSMHVKPLKSFHASHLSEINYNRLRDVFCKGSMLRHVCNLSDIPIFVGLTPFSESNWFKNCVTLMANPLSMIPHEIWRQLFSKYLPK
jgi:hypothetical protein